AVQPVMRLKVRSETSVTPMRFPLRSRVRVTMKMTAIALLVACFSINCVYAQQRPLLIEDPRIIPDATLVAETGIGFERDALFSISGFRGDHFAVGQSG